MNKNWAWLGVVVTIATVFANPSGDLAFLSPTVTLIAGAVAAFATTGIAVVQGLGDKTLNTVAAIGAFVSTALGFATHLPGAVVHVLLVVSAVISAVSMHTPDAAARRARAGR